MSDYMILTQVYMPKSLKEKASDAAHDARKSLSEYIRDLVIADIERGNHND